MYQVLARKWRPKTLDELVGQAHVARTLRNALGSGRIAHAYVFAGLRGTGKTTVARILAKCLNCETGTGPSPCNVCTACTEIAEGRALDVMELDAASRTGVDNIRELQEIVAYAPVRDRNRVLIIDEAHMLSKAAFNALLKTLEEPPPNVVFVMATTEIQKLLPTILSRCQVFEFRRVSVRETAAHLRKLADAEGIAVSDAVLEDVARAGDGSVRDALSVLERLVAFCGTQVDDEDARRVLGGVRSEVLVGFVRAIAARDAPAMLTALDALADEGHDLVHFWGELIGAVRDVMLMRAWAGGSAAMTRSPGDVAQLAEAGASLALEDWTRVFQIFASLEHGLRTSIQPRFLFEGALIRIAGLGAVRPIEDLLAGLPGEAPRAARPGAPAAPQKKNVPEPARPIPAVREARPRDTGFAETRAALLAAVQAARPMIAAMLEQASTIVVDGATLHVGFDASHVGVRKMLAGEENSRALAKLASEALGRPIAVALSEPAGAAPAATEPEAEPLFDRARRDPAVAKIVTALGGQVLDVKPARAVAPAEDARPGEDLP